MNFLSVDFGVFRIGHGFVENGGNVTEQALRRINVTVENGVGRIYSKIGYVVISAVIIPEKGL